MNNQINLEKLKENLGSRFSRDADFLNSVVTRLNIPKTSKVLDIGTGWGTMAIILALHGYRVITGEPEGSFWGDWKSVAKKAKVENMITFQPLNAENLPFEDASFDAVFLYTTLHHIGNKERAFVELIRIIRSKGLLVIIELTDDGVEQVRQRYPGHSAAIDPRDFIEEKELTNQIMESRILNAYIFKKNPQN
ncbi:MAG: class I SAM-dependent methyltransferase [Promethearchaeota archaeon]